MTGKDDYPATPPIYPIIRKMPAMPEMHYTGSIQPCSDNTNTQ